MSVIIPTLGETREIAYNAYIMSLDAHELTAYLKANIFVDGTQQSLELHLHDQFRQGKISEDTLGAEILILLGELD